VLLAWCLRPRKRSLRKCAACIASKEFCGRRGYHVAWPRWAGCAGADVGKDLKRAVASSPCASSSSASPSVPLLSILRYDAGYKPASKPVLSGAITGAVAPGNVGRSSLLAASTGTRGVGGREYQHPSTSAEMCAARVSELHRELTRKCGRLLNAFAPPATTRRSSRMSCAHSTRRKA
jgi:hypothetical protein